MEKWKLGLFCAGILCMVYACKQDGKSAADADKAMQDKNQEELNATAYAVTLDGKRLLEIPEPDSMKIANKAELDAARMHYLGHLSEVKPYLNYGILCLKSGFIENAIQVFGKGLEQFPNTADLHLYRGIAAVQGRQFRVAIDDFWKAGKGVEGQRNVKGILDKSPEEKKIDATIQYDIYKWMGLAFQCQGDFSNAEKMYEVCGDFSTNSDLYCMSYYWQYQSYKRAGRDKDADGILETIDPKMFITPVTKPYLDAMLYYKGALNEQDLVDFNKLPQSSKEAFDWTIKAYAVAVNSLLEKNEVKYVETLEKIMAIPYWNQMPYIAAEAELHKIKGYDYEQMETQELNTDKKKKKTLKVY